MEQIDIPYNGNDDTDTFSLYEDQFLVYCLHKYSYGNYLLMQNEIQMNP